MKKTSPIRKNHTADKPATFKQLKEYFDEKLTNFATKDYLDEKLTKFATKDDLKGFATKDDLKGFATKDDLMEVKTELQSLGSRISLLHKTMQRDYATKEDFKQLATKEDMNTIYNLKDGLATLIKNRDRDDVTNFSRQERLTETANDHEKRIRKLEKAIA